MIRGSARSKASRSSKGSRSSDKQSWIHSLTRKSAGRVHTTFSLHTRLARVLAEDRQDAFDPHATVVKMWEQSLLVCLLLEAFMLPYLLAFQPEVVGGVSIFFVLIIACEFVFTLDLYVQAHMGYYSDGNLIRDKKRTIRRYIRSWHFALDVIAILPVQILVISFPRVVTKLLFVKLLRWSRLPHLVSSLDEFYAKQFVVLKLLKVLASTLYLAHVLACIRFSFGEDTSQNNPWLPATSLHDLPLHRHYLASLFWSVGIMTGLFEGELPRHNTEFLFTILVALCGFSMFTTLCATIFVISKCKSGNTEAVGARINQLVHVLSFHHVPEHQRAQAIEYLKRYYTDADSTDRETAKILCPSIANDIQVELLKATIAEVSIFGGCSDQFIVAMTSLLEMIAVPAQTTLFSVGDHGNAMYVVHSGVLAIIVKSVTVREIRKGSCLGELYVFSLLPCMATVTTTTYAILYKLSRFHCERVLEGYPDCASVIAVHVRAMFKLLNISDDKLGSNVSTSISTPITPRKLTSRRTSVTAGKSAVVAGPTLVKIPSRRDSKVMPSRRESITQKLSRATGAIGPLRRDISQWSKRSMRSERIRDPNPDTVLSADTFLSPALTDPGLGPKAPAGTESPQGPNMGLIFEHHGLWRLILLRRCIDHQSAVRMWWLLLLLSNLCYCWLLIPVQVVFPLWQRPTWIFQTTDTIANVVQVFDIAVNLNLSFMVDSDKVMDPKQSMTHYLKGDFIFDLLCALPYEYLNMHHYGLMRLPRLLRVFHLKKQLKEIEHFIQLNSRRQLLLFILLLIMMFHVVTCIYFGISYAEGFDSNEDEAWVCPTSLCLRRLNATHLENCNGTIFMEATNRDELEGITAMEYFRSLYYAVGVLASPGKTVEPTSDRQLVAALVLMLGGFLISAIVVDNVQKRFTASAFEQKQFFETSTRIQLFLRRQKAPLAIHHRVKSFLDYWWSTHRGAVIRELLADLPRSMRLELLRSICMPVLQTLALLHGVHSVRDKLEEILVENAEFILYGQGETVYRHGDYVTGMFFLLEGEVCVVKMGGPPAEVPRGGFFGTAALTQKERGEGYTEHVSANRGCILLFVSREQLLAMEAIFPALKNELLALDQRLLNNKLAGLNVNTFQEVKNQIEVPSRVFLHKILSGLGSLRTVVYDPDSVFILMWETWVFLVMTLQWVLVIFQACFPLDEGHKDADALMIFLEVSFVLDMFIRSRLGYYEYGNKIMSPQRIKRAYLKSGAFVSDIVALLPLYAINWELPAQDRWDLLNINKLLRLFKVPRQLHALETRYLKRTTELRLFKLLYYTFMLSHFLGCIWFNFASKVAFPNFATSATIKQTAFGDNLWLPPKRLENGSHMLQYMASLYWSFGLMSSSGESEYPQTTAQCIFSVATMTSGVFLFAYVIGNFTDIIELTSSESKEFNVKMGAVRHMLDHFKIPGALQERVNTFLLFKRFHTITQEHLLGQCLPPSLLTDIRLVHLKPMIDKVDFLAGMETSITRMLVSQFTQVLVSRGEFVVKYGDSGSDMFFIFTGIVEVLLPARIANRPKTTFRAVANVLVNRKEGGDGTPNQVGPVMTDIGGGGWQQNSPQEELKKVTEVSAGSYFGENALFTDGRRDAYIQAQTSCILYRLSRESLELVFDRYPKWKQKVLRIANINREQARLLQLSREEQRRGMTTASGKVLSRSDIVNEKAESLKQKRSHTRLQNSDIASNRPTSQKLTRVLDRFIFKPLLVVLDGFMHGVPVQSKFHLFWVRFIVWCTTYVAIMVPYELTMDSMKRKTVAAVFVNTGGLLCQVAFILDVWFSWHVHGSPESMELYDQKVRSVYMKERMIWDILAAIPFYDFLSVYDCSSWFKLARCIKFFNLGSYLAELNRRSVAAEVTRFLHVWMIYLLVVYWAACAYLAVSMEAGFGEEWEGWLPSQELVITNPKNPSNEQLTLRLLRGLFFAMVAFVKKAYCPQPETAPIYAFHIGMSFVGLIVMSYVIGELASLFISYIGLEVNYRKNFIAVELYVARLRLTERLKARTYVFMTSFWSSHAGVNYEDLLAEMPRDIRRACVLHVSKKPLTWFIMKVVSPICWEGGQSIDAFSRSLAERLRFESYPRDEHVVTEGSIVRAMYFVIKGHLNMHSRLLLDRPVGLRSGGYFGERGLLGCSVSAYTVHTVRACDLLSLSSEAFAQVLQEHPFSRLALKVCDRAYKYLKGQHLPSCSRNDMEEHWGEALLLALQAVRTKTQPAPDSSPALTEKPVEVTASSTEVTAISSFQTEAAAPPDDSAARSTRSFQRISSMKHPVIEEDAPAVVRSTQSEFEDLAAHLSTMSKALDTAHGCFEAFAPLLHIMLSTDPLEWNASFNAPSVPSPANEIDSTAQTTYSRRNSPFTSAQ